MSEIKDKNTSKKLLDRLQEESWQLELLVSGFTIFGLFYALDPIQEVFDKAVLENHILRDLYQTVLIAINILTMNLIIHLVLRSLWIGALGLRSVSGDVDIDSLNYDSRFTNYLNKRIGPFDRYIENLEKLCSIIFAISFLLIFYVAAMFIVQFVINYIGSFYTDDVSDIASVFLFSLITLLCIGSVLTLVDYVTQGLLKKNKWVAKFYFPFYWVFSYLTLSFLYRPLYYNLIDNKFGRRVSMILLPFYLSVLFISSLYKEQSSFISQNSISSNEIRANSRNYEDLVEKNNLFISALSIQSKVITDPYIKIKIPLSRYIEARIIKFNESLKPFKDKNRYKTGMDLNGSSITSSFKGDIDSLHLQILKTFQKIYQLKIDSVQCNPQYVIINENNGINLSIGFETYIGTRNLTEGKHILTYSRYKHPDTDSLITVREIPFWFFNDLNNKGQ